MATAAFELTRPRFRLLVVAVAIGWIGWMNHDPFKLRFENLPHYPPERPVVLTEATVFKSYDDPNFRPKSLVDESQLLPRWAQYAQANSAFPGASRNWPSSAYPVARPGRRTGARWSWIGSIEGSTRPIRSTTTSG